MTTLEELEEIRRRCSCLDWSYFKERRPRPLCPIHLIPDRTVDEERAARGVQVEVEKFDVAPLFLVRAGLARNEKQAAEMVTREGLEAGIARARKEGRKTPRKGAARRA